MENFKLLPDYQMNFQVSNLKKINYNHLLHDIPNQWRITQGQGVKVAVLDTGVPQHKDLAGKIIATRNFTNSPTEFDLEGHATHCCGIIAADSQTGTGIVGVAPKVELIVGKVVGDTGEGNDVWLSEAIRWAVAEGADIISMSLGAPGKAERSFPRTRQAVIEAFQKNVYMFAAAGNEGATNVNIPGKWNEVFCIAAIDRDQRHPDFSNVGPEVDFSGIGVNVVSTYLDNQYASLSGTSMATPDVAAVAALILSEHKQNVCNTTPVTNFWELRDHIIRLCTDLGVKGYDGVYGWGNPVFDEPSTELDSNDMGGIVIPKAPVKKSFWQKIRDLFN